MLVLLGVADGDAEAEADRLADKVAKLRIFDDADGRMNEPLGEREVLCVSQFTLLRRHPQGQPARATSARRRRSRPSRSTSGSASGSARSGACFGARMGVELVNDGPVTLLVEVWLRRPERPRLAVNEAGGAILALTFFRTRSVARGGPAARLFFGLDPVGASR